MFKSGKMTLRELFRLAFGIYRHCFKYIAVIGLGIYLPVDIVLMALAARLDVSAVMAGDMSLLLRVFLVAMIIEVAVMPLETAALTYLTRQRLDNAEVSFEGVLDASFGNWRKLFLTALFYVTLVTSCSILIVPALMFGVSFCFYANIVVVDKISGFAAMRKSAGLVRGNWWRTFGTLLLVNLGVLGLQNLIGTALLPVLGYLSAMDGMKPMAQALSIVITVIADILGIGFKISMTLYFFNLYYTSGSATEVSLQ